jgi:hypothetical protein
VEALKWALASLTPYWARRFPTTAPAGNLSSEIERSVRMHLPNVDEFLVHVRCAPARNGDIGRATDKFSCTSWAGGEDEAGKNFTMTVAIGSSTRADAIREDVLATQTYASLSAIPHLEGDWATHSLLVERPFP